MVPHFDNEDFSLAYQLLEHTSGNLFLTGAAGTGKTTFLRKLRDISTKRIVVAAPTGIAAINAGGVTLHSLFQLEFGPFVPGKPRKSNFRFSKKKLDLIRAIDILVIDEVSMVRADLLDYVDETLRRLRDGRKPFGGVQLLLIGDLYQLPPVVREEEWSILQQFYTTPYFFSSHALNLTSYLTIELSKIYRQSDPHFLTLLHDIRGGRPSAETLAALNKQCRPRFTPPEEEHWIQLTTHNHIADSINSSRLAELPGKEYVYRAKIQGTFPDNVMPADQDLALKVGEQVMFIRNDSSGERRYYNGLLGVVSRLTDDTVYVLPETGAEEIVVKPESWENRRYELDEETMEMKDHVDGTFSQIPLRAAWAITIHKSQGLTFDHALIDAYSAFASGQTYVALSRCRTLEGMVLSTPLSAAAVITDPLVAQFIASSSANRPDERTMQLLRRSYRLSLLNDLLDFRQLASLFDEYYRVVELAFHTLYPKLTARYAAAARDFDTKLLPLSRSFQNQYTPLFASATEEMPDAALKVRIKDACAYFVPTLVNLVALLDDTPDTHDNKATLKRLKLHGSVLQDAAKQKLSLLRKMSVQEFSAADYLKARAAASVAATEEKRKPKPKALKSAAPSDLGEDEQRLFEALRKWRAEEADKAGMPAFRIMGTKALINIAAVKPRSMEQLENTKFIGSALATRYGSKILAIVDAHI